MDMTVVVAVLVLVGVGGFVVACEMSRSFVRGALGLQLLFGFMTVAGIIGAVNIQAG